MVIMNQEFYSVDNRCRAWLKKSSLVTGNVDPTTTPNQEAWSNHESMSRTLGGHQVTKKFQYQSIGLEDQLSFERYLKQSMDMNNHAHTGFDDRTVANESLIGEDGSGFIDLEGSELGGFGGRFNSPAMSMYQQSHRSPMIMNRICINMNMHGNMGNVMLHDNIYMHQPQMSNHAPPMFRHAHRAHYY
ncbi:hypothetical protein Tco_0156267 [Tanacetum coccineum]